MLTVTAASRKLLVSGEAGRMVPLLDHVSHSWGARIPLTTSRFRDSPAEIAAEPRSASKLLSISTRANRNLHLNAVRFLQPKGTAPRVPPRRIAWKEEVS